VRERQRERERETKRNREREREMSKPKNLNNKTHIPQQLFSESPFPLMYRPMTTLPMDARLVPSSSMYPVLRYPVSPGIYAQVRNVPPAFVPVHSSVLPIRKRAKRKRARVACVSCHKAKVTCGNDRPCKV